VQLYVFYDECDRRSNIGDKLEHSLPRRISSISTSCEIISTLTFKILKSYMSQPPPRDEYLRLPIDYCQNTTLARPDVDLL
jgi:hypothetical protein